jgi:hypothetical protein
MDSMIARIGSLLVLGLLTSTLSRAAVPAKPTYHSFAKDPRDTLLANAQTPRGFRIIALSHLADACAADGDTACLERVHRAAVHPALLPTTSPRTLLGRDPAMDHGLYASHLALILGRCRLAGGSCDDALHDTLAERLAARSVQHGLVASYPANPARYPADQAVTLLALHLHDRATPDDGATYGPEALSAYRAVVDPLTSESPWGLPPAEATGSAEWSSVPRGCALAWTVQYLAEVDVDVARSIWRPFKRHFYVQVGPMAGFREWPLGEERDADVDSGPIVMGVGAAATAFGIGAATALGAEVEVAQLEGTEAFVRRGAGWVGAEALVEEADASALSVAIGAASRRRARLMSTARE